MTDPVSGVIQDTCIYCSEFPLLCEEWRIYLSFTALTCCLSLVKGDDEA